MNNSLKNLIALVITIATIAAISIIHFFPGYWFHLLIAVLAAFGVEFFKSYLYEYPPLKWFLEYKKKSLDKKLIEEMDDIFRHEKLEEYRKKIIENALKKAKSNKISERYVGLEQISQYGKEHSYTELLKILKKNGLDKSYEKEVVKTICKVLDNMKNMNGQADTD